ncbi:MAG: phosphoribosylanthranilate isomerase [Beijerinckiaceae bacterium]
MIASLTIKICGLSTPDTLQAALDAGADMVGFVFFAPSPRNISFDLARGLGSLAKSEASKVALSVDADDVLMEGIVGSLQPDILQLHGKETPQRMAALKARYGLPLMKAIHVSEAADLAALDEYIDVADRILFDARPPKGAVLPGGNGAAFDWTILHGLNLQKPWMLSGGLDVFNVAQAVHITHARGVDVSSGVESAPGVKDADLIRKFVLAARTAAAHVFE